MDENHPAIIDKDSWEAVQLEFERRRAFIEKHGIGKLDYGKPGNPFSGRAVCGCCGSSFGRKVWNSTDERLRRIIWRCNKKYAIKGQKLCENGHIDDEVLYKAFVKAYNAVVENLEHYKRKWNERIESEDVLKRVIAKRFIEVFKGASSIEQFEEYLFLRIVEKIMVYEEKIIVYLRDGNEVECEV